MYPNVGLRVHRRLLTCRIYLFCALVTQAIFSAIDLSFPTGLHWSAITALALGLGWLCLRLGVSDKAGHRAKLLLLTLAAVGCAIGIDVVLGYRGWSLDYALPIGLLTVDGVLALLMLCNRRNWQSYLMWQLLMLLLSLLPAFLFLAALERLGFLAFAPLLASGTLFLGTMLLGGRRALTELQRRFHIR